MRIGVVGAGIAGVSMTHALRGAGLDVELFEQAAESRSSGYQLNVLPNGIYALSQLGLLKPLLASGVGARIESGPIFDGLSGRVLRSLRFDAGADDAYTSISLYRADLHRVLLESMRGAAPCCGRALVSFAQTCSGKVVASFSDGHQDEFDLLVGADGARSRVRAALFPSHAELIPQMSALLFAAKVDLDGTTEAERLYAEQVERGEFAMYNAPGTAVILSHAGGGRFGVIISVLDAAAARAVETEEHARGLARRLVRDIRDPRVHHAIDIGYWEEGDPLVWSIGDISPLKRFHRGAVVLCGDAAHPMIPVVGQGANQSFEDAWRLSAHLSEAGPGALHEALDRYSRERAPHVARIQKEARRRMRPFRLPGRLAHHLYAAMMRSLPQRILDRFDEHLLAYAIADPSCPVKRL